MKKGILLFAAAVLLLAAGCISIDLKRGNDVFQGMNLKDAALIFGCAEDKDSCKTMIMYQHDDMKQKFIKDLSTASAAPVDNWSFEDLAYPIYGFSLFDAERFERYFAWSNGFLFTEDGKKYKFDFDFAAVCADLPFDDSWESADLSQFSCARQYTLLGDRWNTDFMSVGLEPENQYDVDYEVIGLEDGKLTVRFTNHMDSTYIFGEYYSLQVLVGDTWYSVPPVGSTMFHDLAYELAPDQSYELSYWFEPYEGLPAGHYRVLNGIGLPTRDFAAEFDLPFN